jgi:hypothetical protein
MPQYCIRSAIGFGSKHDAGSVPTLYLFHSQLSTTDRYLKVVYQTHLPQNLSWEFFLNETLDRLPVKELLKRYEPTLDPDTGAVRTQPSDRITVRALVNGWSPEIKPWWLGCPLQALATWATTCTPPEKLHIKEKQERKWRNRLFRHWCSPDLCTNLSGKSAQTNTSPTILTKLLLPRYLQSTWRKTRRTFQQKSPDFYSVL